MLTLVEEVRNLRRGEITEETYRKIVTVIKNQVGNP